MGIEELRAALAATVEEMRALNDAMGDEPTDEQTTRWEDLTAAEAEQRAAIDQAERRQRVDESRTRWRSINTGVPRTDPLGADARSLPGREAVSRARALLDDDELTGHLSGRQKEYAERLLRTTSRDTRGDVVARMMLATSTEAYRSAFMRTLIANGQTPVYTPEEARALNAVNELRAASLTDASGGYAVPSLIDPTVILTSQGSPNEILELARVETITTEKWTGLSSAGVSWQFNAEAAATTDNAPTIAQPEVTPQRCDGFIPYSIEIGMDWPGFADEMVTLLSEGYRELLASKLTNGTSGSSEPIGVVTRLDATTTSERELATAATLAAADVYALWDALPAKWRRQPGCAWMSSTDVQNDLRQLGTVDPNFTVNITEEGIGRLFGRQYPINDYMNDMPAGTGTQALLIVGDWRQYLVAQRAGMSVETVPMLFDVTNNRPTGQRGLFAWARVGGDAIVPGAFRLLVNKSA